MTNGDTTITIPDIKTRDGSEYKVTRVMTLRDYLLGLDHDTIGSVNFRKFMNLTEKEEEKYHKK